MSTILTNIAKATYKTSTEELSDTAQSTFELFSGAISFIKTQSPTSGFAGDTVLFTLQIQPTEDIGNLIVYDDLASVGYTFVTGSVVINGNASPTDDPANGIVIGDVSANKLITITFSGTVN